MQSTFAHHILKGLKKEGIHTAIETCGFFKYSRFSRDILPYVDLILYDLKLVDNEQSKHFTGAPNQLILENYRRLSRLSGHSLVPRIPLIPGITDSNANLSALSDFLESCGSTKPELLPYNPSWLDKMSRLGQVPKYTHCKFMSPDDIAGCNAIFNGRF